MRLNNKNKPTKEQIKFLKKIGHYEKYKDMIENNKITRKGVDDYIHHLGW